MLIELLWLWVGFCIGFFFSFTKKGKEISLMMIIKLDELLPPKKK